MCSDAQLHLQSLTKVAQISCACRKLQIFSVSYIACAFQKSPESLLSRIESILCIPHSSLGIVQLSLLCWDC